MAKKLKKQGNNNELLVEAHKINYRLRSTFFYRKLYEYNTLEFPNSIKQLIPHSANYNWEEFKKWGISDTAYGIVTDSALKLIQVFCHPKLIREHPDLIGYYRNIAVLSQKATRYLSNVDPKKYENEKDSELSESNAFALASLFNEHISLIIENAFEDFREEELQGLLFASTGSQIDGSWRNAIGDEAEKVVQKMLTQEVIKSKELEAFILREDGEIESPNKQNIKKITKDIRIIKGLMLKNQKSILFASEPDITIIDKNGKSLLDIEVKGGTDPAGALERYGAAKKSLENSIRENKTVKTCFLASCITHEVEQRVKRDKTVSKYFNLTQVITDDTFKERFLKYVFGFLSK